MRPPVAAYSMAINKVCGTVLLKAINKVCGTVLFTRLAESARVSESHGR